MLDRLIDLVVTCIDALAFWVVIDPYQEGVQLRLGKFHKKLEAGFHWKLPLHIDRVIDETVVPRTERLSGLATTTADGRSVGFDAVVTYRIADVVKSVLEVSDLKDAIADSCAGIIGTTLSGVSWEEIRRGGTVEALTAACRKRGWKWGVEIQSVQLTGIATVKNLRVALSAHQTAPVTQIHVQ